MPRRSRPLAPLLVLAFTILAAACQPNHPDNRAQQATPVTGVREVVARNLAFTPPAIQVPAGTTVTWRFDDGSVPHNVQGDGYSSKTASRGTFTHRFDRPGSYEYRCTLHAGMTGRVVVVPR
ncbi:MAG TPA: plastocyanin/azurin family copper-binding protein [Actinomycetota bacterium]|nr:plastocyanin/azurin family copper-binding protein [Actinomycetota bacterium]